MVSLTSTRKARLAIVYETVRKSHPNKVALDTIIRILSLEGVTRQTILSYVQTLADSGQILIHYVHDGVIEDNPRTYWFSVRNLRCFLSLPGWEPELRIRNGLGMFLRESSREYATLRRSRPRADSNS